MVANVETYLHTPAQHTFSTCEGACENEKCLFNTRYDTRLESTLGKRQQPAPLSHTQPLGTCFQIWVRVRVRVRVKLRVRVTLRVRVRGDANVRVWVWVWVKARVRIRVGNYLPLYVPV